jgi:beta-galactosidase
MDTFRLPKFGYYFFASQRDPRGKPLNADGGAAVFLATYWSAEERPRRFAVYSNCDEIELLINGRSVARRGCDNGADTEYKHPNTPADPNYWTRQEEIAASEGPAASRAGWIDEMLFLDGGNCRALDYPPFTFDGIPFEAGELRAVGYIGGEKVCEDVRLTPGKPAALSLRFDTCGKDLAADGADFVFVYASVLDERGTLVPYARNTVRFEADDGVTLIGKNPFKAEAGVAVILARAGVRAGEYEVRAYADGLKSAAARINAKEAMV